MQEMQVWSLNQEDPLEEEMAIHFSILAWEIPWTVDGGAWWATVCGVAKSQRDWACMHGLKIGIVQVRSPCFATNINSTWPWSNYSNFVSIIFATASAHFVSLCYILVILIIFQTLSLFLHLLMSSLMLLSQKDYNSAKAQMMVRVFQQYFLLRYICCFLLGIILLHT